MNRYLCELVKFRVSQSFGFMDGITLSYLKLRHSVVCLRITAQVQNGFLSAFIARYKRTSPCYVQAMVVGSVGVAVPTLAACMQAHLFVKT
jgi:hypothetical protein